VPPQATLTVVAGAITAVAPAIPGVCGVEPGINPNGVGGQTGTTTNVSASGGAGSGLQLTVVWAERQRWLTYTQGVDYNLYWTDNGSGPASSCPGSNHTLIPVSGAGSSYVDKNCLEVDMVSAPVAGTNLREYWNDPTAVAGYKIINGHSNFFEAGITAGYATAYDFDDVGNYANCAYAQIDTVLFNAGANANNNTMNCAYDQDGTVRTIYTESNSSPPVNVSIGYGNPHMFSDAYTNVDQNFVTTSGTLRSSVIFNGNTNNVRLPPQPEGGDWVQYQANAPGPNEIEFDGSFTVTGTSGGAASFTLFFQSSPDGGATMNLLGNKVIALNIPATGTNTLSVAVHSSFPDPVLYQSTAGVPPTVWYRAQVMVNTFPTTVTLLGASSARARFRIRPNGPE
jgi:hypothetical protein